MPHRIEVATQPGRPDALGHGWRERFAEDLGVRVGDVSILFVRDGDSDGLTRERRAA